MFSLVLYDGPSKLWSRFDNPFLFQEFYVVLGYLIEGFTCMPPKIKTIWPCLTGR